MIGGVLAVWSSSLVPSSWPNVYLGADLAVDARGGCPSLLSLFNKTCWRDEAGQGEAGQGDAGTCVRHVCHADVGSRTELPKFVHVMRWSVYESRIQEESREETTPMRCTVRHTCRRARWSRKPPLCAPRTTALSRVKRTMAYFPMRPSGEPASSVHEKTRPR